MTAGFCKAFRRTKNQLTGSDDVLNINLKNNIQVKKKKKNRLYSRNFSLLLLKRFDFILVQPQIRKSWDSMENANKKRK